jgi:hypothetical protein
VEETKQGKTGSRTLWIWVILAFVLLISAWTTLIIIASKNQPEVIEIKEP